VRLHHSHGIHIVEQLNLQALGLAEQPCSDGVFTDHEFVIDVLLAINHISRLQTLGVQPTHVGNQELLHFIEGKPRLRFGR